jgi:hypothetical protein
MGTFCGCTEQRRAGIELQWRTEHTVQATVDALLNDWDW